MDHWICQISKLILLVGQSIQTDRIPHLLFPNDIADPKKNLISKCYLGFAN
jgi:hypothetical protein